MNKLFINEDEIMSQQAREVFRSFRSNIEFTGVDNRAIVIEKVQFHYVLL